MDICYIIQVKHKAGISYHAETIRDQNDRIGTGFKSVFKKRFSFDQCCFGLFIIFDLFLFRCIDEHRSVVCRNISDRVARNDVLIYDDHSGTDLFECTVFAYLRIRIQST